MAWFSYLIFAINKIIQIYYLLFALSGLRGENDVSGMINEKGIGIKKFQKHWIRSYTLILGCKMIPYDS